MSFSPRNGEIILKFKTIGGDGEEECFSPRNGEIILKGNTVRCGTLMSYPARFSPRNGEIILKGHPLETV